MAAYFQRISYTAGLLLFMLVWTAMVLCFPRAAVASHLANEYDVKAVFLYNLAHFVSWPENWHNSAETFTIGIIGEDPFGNRIDKAVADESLQNKPIRVVRYKSVGQLRENLCDILFISASSISDFNDIKEILGEFPVLTVADTDGFPTNGGMVNLMKRRQQIEVEVNRKAIEKANLFVSSKLLRLARIVE